VDALEDDTRRAAWTPSGAARPTTWEETTAMKLGFSTWAMPRVPIDDALNHIASLGYTGVEITVHRGWVTDVETLEAGERRRIRARVRDLNLDLPAITCPGTLVGEPAAIQHSLGRVKAAIDLAAEWAGPEAPPYVVTIPGGKPEDWDDPAQRQALVDSTGELAAYCERRGVIFAFEAHVLQIVETPDQMLWVMEQVASPAFKLNFDISHFNVIGVPIEESVEKLVPGGRSVHTHVKDERGRSPNHEYLIPGEGEFDYVRYYKALEKAGYTGYLVPEISMMVQRRPNYDPFQAATTSYEVFQRTLAEAGMTPTR
jgi:sugar phosphate isomerase/epimerase